MKEEQTNALVESLKYLADAIRYHADVIGLGVDRAHVTVPSKSVNTPGPQEQKKIDADQAAKDKEDKGELKPEVQDVFVNPLEEVEEVKRYIDLPPAEGEYLVLDQVTGKYIPALDVIIREMKAYKEKVGLKKATELLVKYAPSMRFEEIPREDYNDLLGVIYNDIMGVIANG